MLVEVDKRLKSATKSKKSKEVKAKKSHYDKIINHKKLFKHSRFTIMNAILIARLSIQTSIVYHLNRMYFCPNIYNFFYLIIAITL